LPLLELRDVTQRFGGVLALDDVSFSVEEGEIAGLIGPNGAGKTTAFNVVTGFLRPTKGEVHFRGAPLHTLKPHQVASTGLVRTFQKTSLFSSNTVFENVLTGMHRHGSISAWATLLALPSLRREEARLRESAWEILDFVGIAHRADELGGSLPYGEQRLLGVAVALAAGPNMLLLDEPAAGMNPSETAEFMSLLTRIRQRGISILLVEHDMPLVMGVSDRIVVLNYGKIIANGSPAEIQANPEVIRAYLGQGVKHA